ncbi:hypothetical protein [Tistrella mobilis]
MLRIPGILAELVEDISENEAVSMRDLTVTQADACASCDSGSCTGGGGCDTGGSDVG